MPQDSACSVLIPTSEGLTMNLPIFLTTPRRLSEVPSWHEHLPFAMYLVDLVRPKTIVELGTHKGDSYCAFCQAVAALKLDTRCFAVDTWKGDEQAGFYGPEVLEELRAYHDPLYGSFSQLLQTTFDDALQYFGDGTITILHIDGCHTYEAVKHDFESWLPKLSTSGVVLLHDTNVRERNFGVWKLWEELAPSYPHFEFLHGHGLGVLGVGKEQPPALRDLFGTNGAETATFRESFYNLGRMLTFQDDMRRSATEREDQIASLQQEIVVQRQQAAELARSRDDLQRRVGELEPQASQQREQLTTLQRELDLIRGEQNAQIAESKQALAEREGKIAELSQVVDERNRQITDFEQTIHQLSAQVREKQRLTSEHQSVFAQRDLVARDLGARLNQIESSNGWRALQRYYRLRDRLLPGSSSRRRVVRFLWRVATRQPLSAPGQRLLKGPSFSDYFWSCKTYGVLNATKLAFERLRKPAAYSSIGIHPLAVPDPAKFSFQKTVPLIRKKLSVVIPTKNAGPDFRFVLKKLKAQKGLQDSEIIVVDSGSTDGTLDIARKEGAKVLEIPPASFNHAFSRNRGAEQATGDYVLFMVQDAIPLTDRWLWEMAKTLEGNDVVAVSCAEFPRSGCDLFYRWLSWSHYRALNLHKDRILAWDESCSSYLGLRSNSQISNIAALVKRDVFNKYEFTKKYAEDLDLGMRLIRDGHKIAFLYSTRILHSHNRTAYYFLKRAYVDNRFLAENFPDHVYPTVEDKERLFRDIASLYFRTKRVACAIANLKNPEQVGTLIARIRTMYHAEQGELQTWDDMMIDDELGGFVRELIGQVGTDSVSYTWKDNIISPHFLHHFEQLGTYVAGTCHTADGELACDLAAALYKLAALHSGAHLAYLYLTLSRGSSPVQWLADFDRELIEGV